MKKYKARQDSIRTLVFKLTIVLFGGIFLSGQSLNKKETPVDSEEYVEEEKGWTKPKNIQESKTQNMPETNIQDNSLIPMEDSPALQINIQSDGYQGLYHKEIVVGTEKYKEIYHAGDGIDVILTPEAFGTEVLTVFSITRSQGHPAYGGTLRITDTPEGLLLVNEIDLETYLQGVLPSEMPADYPTEALKAQAVCARTYALYQQEQGAVIDDSTNYQVYNNVAADERCNEAIRDTAGEILTDEKQNPAEIYYYSTSATDAVESKENWYHWEYANTQMSAYNMATRINSCKPGTIQHPSRCKFYDMEITLYRQDGRAQQLKFTTTEGCVYIDGEYVIRTVLCDGVSEVCLQDGTGIVMEEMIPSAFFTMETIQKGKYVIGYRLSGGGFGHGNGMSQNGAKAYANQGYSYEEILARYYPDLKLESQ